MPLYEADGDNIRLSDSSAHQIALHRSVDWRWLRDSPNGRDRRAKSIRAAFENLLITTGVGEGPYCAKGVGEVSHLTMPAAIANAVCDAVGARVTQLPITAERVYDAMREQPS